MAPGLTIELAERDSGGVLFDLPTLTGLFAGSVLDPFIRLKCQTPCDRRHTRLFSSVDRSLGIWVWTDEKRHSKRRRLDVLPVGSLSSEPPLEPHPSPPRESWAETGPGRRADLGVPAHQTRETPSSSPGERADRRSTSGNPGYLLHCPS